MTNPTDRFVSGFTEFDLATLNEFSARQVADRRWSRAHVVHGPCADFLAVWEANAAPAALPSLTIARFKRTGTYVLTIGALVVATARNLDKVLPMSRRDEVQPPPLPA